MFKRLLYASCILLLVTALVVGYAGREANRVPKEMETYYNQFIEAFSEGTFDDIKPFLHFEIEEYQQLMEHYFSNIRNVQLESWERINDDLWVANTYVETDTEPEGNLTHYFVGKVDGEMRIMIGVFQVPDELADGEDLSRFISPDMLIPGQFVIS